MVSHPGEGMHVGRDPGGVIVIVLSFYRNGRADSIIFFFSESKEIRNRKQNLFSVEPEAICHPKV